MTVREELHHLVEQMTEDDIAEVLDYVQWLLRADDTSTAEELERVRRGEAEIARGETVRFADLDKPAPA
ncbi:MAG TPA: hypothetical protein VKV26_10150 [Dehalococcoidia bacterium]|nr:hypothetical protein [Dehalococcoidia bacterium]